MAKMGFRNSKAAKLSAQDVLSIRERFAAGATQGSLSKEYQVSVTQIGRICRGEVWQQLAAMPLDQGKIEQIGRELFLKQEMAKDIRAAQAASPEAILSEMDEKIAANTKAALSAYINKGTENIEEKLNAARDAGIIPTDDAGYE